MCDTDYTSKTEWEGHASYFPDYLAAEWKSSLYVITGGEPLLQADALSWFFENVFFDTRFQERGHPPIFQIETNGTIAPPPEWGYDLGTIQIVVSPKTKTLAQGPSSYGPSPYSWVDNYKYVMSADSVCPNDGLPTSVLGRNIRPFRPPDTVAPDSVFLQPEDSGNPVKNQENIRACVESCMKYGYRLQLQIQKICNID